MPRVQLILYQEPGGGVPLLDWFDGLVPKAREKCGVRLERLAELGHELRRPESAYLRQDIYELRARHQNVNLRMLYFFHGRTTVVISHGLVKQQSRVPPLEIELAVRRKMSFESSPDTHTHGS